MVFGPCRLVPSTAEAQPPHDHTSPPPPLTPPSCTSTPRVSSLTVGGNGIAGQRKKLEDSVSRFVSEDCTYFPVYLRVFLFHSHSLPPTFPTFLSCVVVFCFCTFNFPPSFPLPSLLLPPPTCSYLSLVPTELQSAEVVTGETGIEDYLIEAHQQVNFFT